MMKARFSFLGLAIGSLVFFFFLTRENSVSSVSSVKLRNDSQQAIVKESDTVFVEEDVAVAISPKNKAAEIYPNLSIHEDLKQFLATDELDPNNEASLEIYNQLGIKFESYILNDQDSSTRQIFDLIFDRAEPLTEIKAAFLIEIILTNHSDKEGLVKDFSGRLAVLEDQGQVPANALVFADLLTLHFEDWEIDKMPENVDRLLESI